MSHFLDFEKPVAALEGKIEELRHLGGDTGVNIAEEIGKLQLRIDKELETTYAKLGAWEKVQVARHPERPKLVQIIDHLFDEFIELSGDRAYAEDFAIIGGMVLVSRNIKRAAAGPTWRKSARPAASRTTSAPSASGSCASWTCASASGSPTRSSSSSCSAPRLPAIPK